MQYSSVENLQFQNEEHTLISCVVQFAALDTKVEFVASPDDVEAHGREIFQRCIAGEFGPIADYVPYVPSADEQIASLRQHTQGMLDAEARGQGFQSLADALTYVDEPAVPEFQQRALKLRAWRSVIWSEFEVYKQLLLEGQDVTTEYTKF